MVLEIVQKTGQGIRFYHTDHLGSTALVTGLDGEVTLHVAYIPYGEIFVEQRNGSWNTPYLFNAKELDEETGLYYYGARYLDPSEANWLSIDPMFESHIESSPYAYCLGNPVRMIDSDGREETTSESNSPKIVPVYIEEKKWPNIYQNHKKAIERGHPALLTYDSDKKAADIEERKRKLVVL